MKKRDVTPVLGRILQTEANRKVLLLKREIDGKVVPDEHSLVEDNPTRDLTLSNARFYEIDSK